MLAARRPRISSCLTPSDRRKSRQNCPVTLPSRPMFAGASLGLRIAQAARVVTTVTDEFRSTASIPSQEIEGRTPASDRLSRRRVDELLRTFEAVGDGNVLAVETAAAHPHRLPQLPPRSLATVRK